MKYTAALLLLSTTLFSSNEVNTLSEVFTQAKVSGNVRYYYIQTDKDNAYTNTKNTSAHAHSLGGQLHLQSATLKGFNGGATIMTTNPFFLDSQVDTSIIGKDNGVRGYNPNNGFTLLGEAYLGYEYQDLNLLVGRKVIHSPLVDAKEVRMLPSSFEGFFTNYKLDESTQIDINYLSRFKQRTSDEFTDIITHALGSNTQAITGGANEYIVMADIKTKISNYGLSAYEYYAKDFMNSIYLGFNTSLRVKNQKFDIALQYINQQSIGNADTNLDKSNSISGGKKINANELGIKVSTDVESAKFMLAYTNVLSSARDHDSLVLPWDGTPLFTNMVTSNDLFQSLYGNALKADSVYIGGTKSIKVAYTQKFDSFGFKGFSTTLAYMNASNSRFAKDQNDYNAIVAYKYDDHFSLALKAMLVKENTSADALGTVTQLKELNQYRVIANYNF